MIRFLFGVTLGAGATWWFMKHGQKAAAEVAQKIRQGVVELAPGLRTRVKPPAASLRIIQGGIP